MEGTTTHPPFIRRLLKLKIPVSCNWDALAKANECISFTLMHRDHSSGINQLSYDIRADIKEDIDTDYDGDKIDELFQMTSFNDVD
jgi:hypothetical protein